MHYINHSLLWLCMWIQVSLQNGHNLRNNYLRFYTVRSSDYNDSVQKWTSPPVHDLRKIYQHLEIANILDPLFDKSMKAIQNFKVPELRYYCTLHKLPKSGNKVFQFIIYQKHWSCITNLPLRTKYPNLIFQEVLVHRLKQKLGENAKVSACSW